MKTRILVLIIVIVSIVFVVGSIFVGKNQSTSAENLTKEAMPGYTEITSVPGVSFYVNSPFVEKATAITQVSDNISFQKNQYYSYKNGTDKYLLFNMEDLIVAAQKGTDFWIGDSNDKEFSLLNANIMNIWFTQGSKKFESETNNGMTVTKVNAGVAINSTTYGDFCGKLVNINKDGEEWSLFVGVPGERYDKLSDASQGGIDNIINTFMFSNSSDLLSQDIYAVSVEGDNSRTKVETTEEIFEYDENSLNLTNQTTVTEKEEDKAYTSSPYNMLSLGDNGLMSTFNDHTIDYEDAIICPIKVYRGEEAENLIKEFCTATNQYEYIECPPGSAWEVVEYKLNYKDCVNDNYVDIKLKGVDGEVLKYRGIKYTARTYDMLYKAEEDGKWILHNYVYYAVPNGCLEYCLECGERESKNGTEINAAYYHIMNVNEQPKEADDLEEDVLDEEEKSVMSIEDSIEE